MMNAARLETAPAQFVNAQGIKFAYRRFGRAGETPSLFLQHFPGTMDFWDPAVVNALAEHRTVVVFNNRGVGTSDGETPDNVAQMAVDALQFILALGLKRIDLLGYWLGGFIAQKLAGHRPALVRRLILVGTAPQCLPGCSNTGEVYPGSPAAAASLSEYIY